MGDHFGKLLEEAIKLELYVSDLYMVFYRKFPEDSDFWWKLAIEEQNHAALLKTVRKMNNARLNVPEGIVPPAIEMLVQSNEKLIAAIEDFEHHPDRNRAFRFAFMVEHSAGELHYEEFMKYSNESRLTAVFRKLNGDDIDHAARIRKYMTEHHIPVDDLSDAGL